MAPGWSSFAQRSMRTVSPCLIGRALAGVGSKCGSAGCSLVPTIGYSPLQVRPSSPYRLTMNCWTSYCVRVRPAFSSVADQLERLVLDPLHAFAGREVRLVARLVEDGLEGLHQARGRHDFETERSDEIDGAAVHERHIGDVRHRRVLHRDLLRGAEHLLQARVELLPGEVEALLAGKRFELLRLDLVAEANRLAGGGDPVEPAPAGELAVIHAEHVVRDGVPVMEVVEQPTVRPRRLHFCLNPRDIRHGRLLRFVEAAG